MGFLLKKQAYTPYLEIMLPSPILVGSKNSVKNAPCRETY